LVHEVQRSCVKEYSLSRWPQCTLGKFSDKKYQIFGPNGLFKLPPCIDFQHLGMFRHVFANIKAQLLLQYKGIKNPFRIACYCKTFYTSSSTNSNLFGCQSWTVWCKNWVLAAQFSRLLEMLFMEWKLQSLNKKPLG
jgi:hypothetical protein